MNENPWPLRSRTRQQGEIAYAVKVGQWRRGIGSAIATDLLTQAFAAFELHRVAATCDPRNRASAAVLAKVGMVHEGRLRHTIQIRDGWRDSDVYSILAHEWAPPSPFRYEETDKMVSRRDQLICRPPGQQRFVDDRSGRDYMMIAGKALHPVSRYGFNLGDMTFIDVNQAPEACTLPTAERPVA